MEEWLKHFSEPTAHDYARLATVDDAAGDAAGADAALKKAAALPGGVAPAAITRSQILYRHGDRPGAEQALRELLRQQPGNRRAMLDLGLVLTSENRYKEAIATYRQATAGLSRAPDIHYRIALLLHREGRDREAREECEIALKESPNDSHAKALMTVIDTGTEQVQPKRR